MMGLEHAVPAVESYTRAYFLSPTQEIKIKLEAAEALKDVKVFTCCCCGEVREKPIMKCGQCQRVQYCSRGCQVEDWKLGHKQLCVSMKNCKK